ncbi:MAG: B12-binding domain-containing radical SAM protein [Bacillota bacterium]
MESKIIECIDTQFENYCKNLASKLSINNKILLVNPPQFDLKKFDMDKAKMKGYYAYPPSGLLFLASSLEMIGVQVEICDLNFEVLHSAAEKDVFDEDLWKLLLEKRLDQFQPSFVGVSCMFSHLSTIYEEVLSYLKGLDKYCILTGGPHVSFEYSSILQRELCHFAITKDSEKKIVYLISRLLDTRKKYDKTSGIFYMISGEIYESEGDMEQPDIDIDITDSYRLIPIEKYCEAGSLNQFSRITGSSKPFSTLSMNRGCRGHCTFCSVRGLLGKKIRGRSIYKIVNEIKYLVHKKGIIQFDWLDDDLLADRSKCLMLFKALKEENLNISWYANNGLMAASLDDTLLSAMVDSGCVGFKIGIESGNEEIMKKIRKPATVSKLLQVSKILEKYPQLFVAGNYIIGFPNELFSQMLDTFILSNRMNIDWAGFYICQPLKGTDDFDSFEAIGDERCKERPDNYLPANDLENRLTDKEFEILKGLDIFNIDPDSTVSREQLKEIWFVFGFITNFINNKNIKENARTDKFINWVVAAMEAYPYDAGMALFLYLAYIIDEKKEKAVEYKVKCENILDKSQYWQERFDQFELKPLIKTKDLCADEIFLNLKKINQKIDKRIEKIICKNYVDENKEGLA